MGDTSQEFLTALLEDELVFKGGATVMGLNMWQQAHDMDHDTVDVSYVAPQAYGIINVALHREYSPGIVFIFSHGRKYLYHV
jgi:hypothetical protein